MTTTRSFILTSWLLLLVGQPVAAESVATPSLSFGIVPQQSAATLARLWSPVLKYLTEATGDPLQFETATDIPVFEQRLAAGEYDLAYMNPYHYTVFHRAPGYQAFAKEKDRRIQGILVVLKDSHYQRPEDLDGQTLVFPAPAAFAASMLPRASLRARGIQFTPKYVASHDSVYLAVAKGLYPAGGGIARTLETIAPETRERLRILWKTDTYTPHAIAAHPRVPAEVVRRLQQAMVDMEQHPEGRELLQAIGFKGIAPAEDADWDDIRALGITELDELVP